MSGIAGGVFGDRASNPGSALVRAGGMFRGNADGVASHHPGDRAFSLVLKTQNRADSGSVKMGQTVALGSGLKSVNV